MFGCVCVWVGGCLSVCFFVGRSLSLSLCLSSSACTHMHMHTRVLSQLDSIARLCGYGINLEYLGILAHQYKNLVRIRHIKFGKGT